MTLEEKLAAINALLMQLAIEHPDTDVVLDKETAYPKIDVVTGSTWESSSDWYDSRCIWDGED